LIYILVRSILSLNSVEILDALGLLQERLRQFESIRKSDDHPSDSYPNHHHYQSQGTDLHTQTDNNYRDGGVQVDPVRQQDDGIQVAGLMMEWVKEFTSLSTRWIWSGMDFGKMMEFRRSMSSRSVTPPPT
jgi:hypothetical protein